MRSLRICNCAWLALLTISSARAVRAQDMTLELDPAKTTIEISLGALGHSVHGRFVLKRGSVHFNPKTGSASGLIVVDAASGDTENKRRDHKMHSEVLESQRYAEITFTPGKVSGALNLPGTSEVQVEGVINLHGGDHPISLPLTVHADGNNLHAKTHFEIPYASWGLKNPSTFLLRVSETVEVDIEASGKLTTP
jgi:polyisoprenoid-binding protein YceI